MLKAKSIRRQKQIKCAEEDFRNKNFKQIEGFEFISELKINKS